MRFSRTPPRTARQLWAGDGAPSRDELASPLGISVRYRDGRGLRVIEVEVVSAPLDHVLKCCLKVQRNVPVTAPQRHADDRQTLAERDGPTQALTAIVVGKRP